MEEVPSKALNSLKKPLQDPRGEIKGSKTVSQSIKGARQRMHAQIMLGDALLQCQRNGLFICCRFCPGSRIGTAGKEDLYHQQKEDTKLPYILSGHWSIWLSLVYSGWQWLSGVSSSSFS